jgi:prolyl oligopeptidase
MTRTLLILVSGAFMLSCGKDACKTKETPIEQIKVEYPETRKDTTVKDDYFGNLISDPYRWLENDTTAETKAWVETENKLTFGYLGKIPFRDKIKSRLTEIWNYPKYSTPFKEGSYYFFYKNDGLQNQSVLYFHKELNDEPRVLIDPNKLSPDGTTSLSGFSVSKDGAFAGYSLSEGGSDWQTIYVMTLADQKQTPDKIKWVKFSGISWYKDGFFYSRFPEPRGSELSTANNFQKVYYHKMGTTQDKDILVYEDKSNPLHGHYAGVSEDERWLTLITTTGTYGNTMKVKDLSKGMNAPWVNIVDDFNNESNLIDNEGDDIYLMTNIDADKYRLVKVNVNNPDRKNWQTIIPQDDKVMTGIYNIGGKWIATYLKDACSLVKVFDHAGKYLYDVDLPTRGTVGGFGGKKNEKESFYLFTSFVMPPTIYKYDTEANKSELFRKTEIKFDTENYEVKQEFYTSKDGTKIPMFIVYKKGIRLNGKNPTLLYGYGGFDISILPSFQISQMVFLEKGGVYAVANLRGGGEYGQEWHKAGMLMKKQNVFDDFIAAAEYLIEKKYTNPKKLAIHGRSNGGLLVGAVMTQRPDLFRVALPAVGVLDMLRYHKFTIGYAWAVEYGSSDNEEDFKNLITYSPLHNVKEGVEYPCTMVLTADHDDRVVPAHSFKFAATLQEKQKGLNPVLIRIDTKAGHGAGKSTTMAIEEWADIWAFTMFNLGMKYD